MGWSEKYKKSINCDNPKGFSQRAHCQGRKKKMQEAKEQEKDHEVSMAQTQLKKSEENIRKLRKALGTKEKNIPAWVQAKITDTEHNTDAASSYMDEGKRDGKSAKDKDYSLHDWFKGGGWVQAGGKYDGKPCAKQKGQKTKPFCRDADDRAAMSKEERNKRAKKKRKEDPNPNRKGKAKMVREAYQTKGTKKYDGKFNDAFRKAVEGAGGDKKDIYIPKSQLQQAHYEPEGEMVSEGGRAPERATQEAAAAALRKSLRPGQTMDDVVPPFLRGLIKPVKTTTEQVVSEEGKKDACYKKVKARYDVWPSAYASGALVKCRKVGAANWGNKTKKESYEYSNWRDDFKALEIETIDLIKPEPLVSEQQANSQKDQKGLLGTFVGGETTLEKANKELRTIRRLKQKTGLNVGTTPTNNVSYSNGVADIHKVFEAKGDPCWVGYKQVGMKKKGGKMVPNCVKEGYSNWREELAEDWQKVNKKDKTDGMSQKAVDAYKRENPGSKLKTAVTEKNPGGKRAKRRKSFCARSNGQRKMHNIDCSKTPDKAICKARKRWRC